MGASNNFTVALPIVVPGFYMMNHTEFYYALLSKFLHYIAVVIFKSIYLHPYICSLDYSFINFQHSKGNFIKYLLLKKGF